jgi:DNA-binding MarR family transcriptional regulator
MAAQVMETIPRLMRWLHCDARPELGKDLTVWQLGIVAQLSHRPRTAGELAEHRGVSPSAMSRMVGTLQRRGFVTRTAAAGDRRRIMLVLTPRGRARFHEFRRRLRTRFLLRIRRLPAGEQRTLVDGLAILQRLLA